MSKSSNSSFLFDGRNDPIEATVLSLFDGASCGQQALKELGIPKNCKYDKHWRI